LPPYYVIRNCILIACALDDWREADVYRLAAEQSYDTTLKVATQYKDKESLEALQDLREELDELDSFRREDLTALADAQRAELPYDDMEIDEDNDEDMENERMEEEYEAAAEQEAVADAENDVEVAAEALRLPIRPVGGSDGPVTTDPTNNPSNLGTPDIVLPTEDSASTSSAPKLHKKKSTRFSKGNAFNAHEFTKSLGKGYGSRASLSNMEWYQKEKEKEDK
jgi:hypothetical protein